MRHGLLGARRVVRGDAAQHGHERGARAARPRPHRTARTGRAAGSRRAIAARVRAARHGLPACEVLQERGEARADLRSELALVQRAVRRVQERVLLG